MKFTPINDFCREIYFITLLSFSLGMSLTSHAGNADNAYDSIAAAFPQGIGIYGTVELDTCVIKTDPMPPKAVTSDNTRQSVKNVAISLSNANIIRMTIDDSPTPTYILRSHDLRSVDSDTQGVHPGWIIREFRFNKGQLMEAEIQLSGHEVWKFDCSDDAVNITHEIPLTPPVPKPDKEL